MEATNGIKALLQHYTRQWLSSKGIILVLAATLLPLVLTGAWVLTHDDDVVATELTWSPADPRPGDNVTLTARVSNVGGSSVESFNVTMAIGRVSGNQLFPDATTTERVGPLDPGEETTVTLDWTAAAGGRYALLSVDPEDEIAEIDEANNQLPRPVLVRQPDLDPADAPRTPASVEGADEANATGTVSLAVVALDGVPASVTNGDPINLTATVRNDGTETVTNATAYLQVARTAGNTSLPVVQERKVLTLEPGEEATLQLNWTAREGGVWARAYVEPPAGLREADTDDNHVVEPMVVQSIAPSDPPAPPERVTIKEFYLDVLSLLHLRFLLPFIALFYAAGVVADDRSAGNLGYLLTRPVPRWSLPLVRFAASFVVAAAAASLGIVLTFLWLFGTSPQADIGFLTTPLLAGLLTLLAYGAVFTVLGVVVERPYLVGAVLLIGWETVATLLVPWVANLTLAHHVGTALSTWPLDQGLVWLPAESASVRALVVLVVAAVAAIGAAAVMVQRREFATVA